MQDNTTGVIALPDDPGPEPAPFQRFQVRHAQIRVFDRADAPDSDDASDMYVIEVFGVSALIRLRTPRGGGPPELYVHIDNEGRAATDLAVEVGSRGELRCQL